MTDWDKDFKSMGQSLTNLINTLQRAAALERARQEAWALRHDIATLLARGVKTGNRQLLQEFHDGWPFHYCRCMYSLENPHFRERLAMSSN